MDKFIKRDANGSVDVDASLAAFASELNDYVKKNELPAEDIAKAVDDIFDKFPGQRLAMPALISLATNGLITTPDQHKFVAKRVHSYIQGQAEVAKRFEIGKGKSGGVARLYKVGEPVASPGAADTTVAVN